MSNFNIRDFDQYNGHNLVITIRNHQRVSIFPVIYESADCKKNLATKAPQLYQAWVDSNKTGVRINVDGVKKY